jgi:hypothetical protein
MASIDDQLAAARELLADGADDPAAALQEMFNIAQATAYRRLAAAQSDQQAEQSAGRQTVDMAELALAECWQLVRSAKDQDQRLAAINAAANLMHKLKIRSLPTDLLP